MMSRMSLEEMRQASVESLHIEGVISIAFGFHGVWFFTQGPLFMIVLHLT
jgi:hypothetical protein